MGDTIVKLYQKQNFVIGEDILRTIKKNNLTLDEALLIIYFCSNNTHPVLDIDEIKQKFGMSESDIMQAFSHIVKKGLVSIKMVNDRDGKIEELIDLTSFYKSIAEDFSEKAKNDESDSVFLLFERQLARPLSPTELEIINKWLDQGIDENLITCAVKEAVYNGAFTLRYIDAILNEWKRIGLKSEKDVDVYLKKRRQPKSVRNETPDYLNFDYNWFEDED